MLKYISRGFKLMVDGTSRHMDTVESGYAPITIEQIEKWYMRSYEYDSARIAFYESIQLKPESYLEGMAFRKLNFLLSLYPNNDILGKIFRELNRKKFHDDYYRDISGEHRPRGTNVQVYESPSANELTAELSKVNYRAVPHGDARPLTRNGEGFWFRYQSHSPRAPPQDPEQLPPHPFVSIYRYEFVRTNGQFYQGRHVSFDSSQRSVDVTQTVIGYTATTTIDNFTTSERLLCRPRSIFQDLSSRETVKALYQAICSASNLPNGVYLAGGAMLYLIGAVDKFPADLDVYSMQGEKIDMISIKFDLGPYKDCCFMHLPDFSRAFIENGAIHRIRRYALTINGIRTKVEIQVICMKHYYSRLERTPADLMFDIDVCALNWSAREELDEAIARQQELVDRARTKIANFQPEHLHVMQTRDGTVFWSSKKIKRIRKYWAKGFKLMYCGTELKEKDLEAKTLKAPIDDVEARAAEYAKRILPAQ
jgi:hypothetical protein